MGKDEKGYGGTINEGDGGEREEVMVATKPSDDPKTPLVSSPSKRSRPKTKKVVGCCASFFRCLRCPGVKPKELERINVRLNEDLPDVIKQIASKVAISISDSPSILETDLDNIKDKIRDALGDIPSMPIPPEFLREYFGDDCYSDVSINMFVYKVSDIMNKVVARSSLERGSEVGISPILREAMISFREVADRDGKEIKEREKKACGEKWKCCFKFAEKGSEEVFHYNEKPSGP